MLLQVYCHLAMLGLYNHKRRRVMIEKKVNTKRKESGLGTIRKRKNGLFEGRITIGYDTETGKQKQHSVYARTKTECRKKLTAVSNEVDEDCFIAPSQMTVEAWLKEWLSEYNLNVKPRTFEKYSSVVTNNIIPHIGKYKLSDLNAHHIQRLYNGFMRGSDGMRKLSSKSIHDIHGVLHKALKKAVDLEMIRKNPTERCDLPRIETREIVPMDSKQIGDFLSAIKGDRFENLLTIDLFTGMRLGEILALSWDCIDFESGKIRIYRQLHQRGGEYTFGSLKSDKPRMLMVAPSVLEILKAQRIQQLEWRVAAGGAWSNSENLVFTDEIGRHLARNSVYQSFKRAAEQIGAPKLRFHDLRHTYATASLKAGDDLKTLQHNLGHYTAAFTMAVYGHVTEEMQQVSASRMEGFIKSISAR